ncbi:SpoIIE family protein phosphatase [Streptomyces diastaticus]|uniref:SpoIIE family protein phosphatase n=1 Tax=Streptomyces diastaticus TaxID=1956 RepID=UPI003667996C
MVFDIECFDGSEVAAGLVTRFRHKLIQRTPLFERLFACWRSGQEARTALTVPAHRPVLQALDSVGTDRPPPRVDLSGASDDGFSGPCLRLVHCLPVTSRYGPALLVLATHAPDLTGVAPGADTAEHEANLMRYEALLAATPQVVCRVTQQGEVFTLVGRAGDVGDGLRDPGRSVRSWEARIHPADRVRFDQEWADAARNVVPLDTVVRAQRVTTTVSYRHVRVQAVPLLCKGAVSEWIGSVADAEEQWRLRTRDRLLERAAGAASARDLPEAYAAVAGAVVPDLTDAFLVFQLRHAEQTQSEDEALYATRPQTTTARGVPQPPPVGGDFALGSLAKEAIDTRQTRLVVFPPGEPPRDQVSTPTADWMVQANATSLVLIPIVIDERTVALVAGASCLGNPPLGESEVSVLEEILRTFQDPLRRSLELQSIRNTALVLQRSFLITPPHVDGGQVAAVYRPTSTTAEIGGDWYDATVLPDGALALSIGDIVGHDLEAATEMTKASSMLRALAYTHDHAGPAHTLGQLDQVMQGVSSVALVTAAHAVLRPRSHDRSWDVMLSNAGHPPPLLVPAAAPAHYLYGPQPADPPLCVASWIERHDWHHTLHPGDTLVLYTDGLVETPGADISDGLTQLASRATDLRRQRLSLSRLVTKLLARVGGAGDDIAIIAFQASNDF